MRILLWFLVQWLEYTLLSMNFENICNIFQQTPEMKGWCKMSKSEVIIWEKLMTLEHWAKLLHFIFNLMKSAVQNVHQGMKHVFFELKLKACNYSRLWNRHSIMFISFGNVSLLQEVRLIQLEFVSELIWWHLLHITNKIWQERGTK